MGFHFFFFTAGRQHVTKAKRLEIRVDPKRDIFDLVEVLARRIHLAGLSYGFNLIEPIDVHNGSLTKSPSESISLYN